MNNSGKKIIENEIKKYCCSLTAEEKKEDRFWLKVAERYEKGLWND